MYLGQEDLMKQVSPETTEALKTQAGQFPAKVAVGSLVWFFLIYWFLIRR